MGVTIETLVPGDGKTFPKKGDKVTIHYVGTLLDGSKFDSSRDRGRVDDLERGAVLIIDAIIDLGVPQLSLGQKAVLTASPDYAYGSRGFPPVIPPNSTLKFEVELLKINGVGK
ncbi:FK506-binding protein 1 [Coprinopsis cinerea okayama7|uniref:peptidylprolyl isomerase n=1 Tax=Coprinopsis cinerea (strain Okayama-7 / 130 / ATCC MYA-4618 / FGSC 9003) TaxID=240176 RepID=A8N0P0_COPC7|nr:FK506-binding protein 1 [Coprinopsis cinerea okayama7\|eukprot:XP_001828372.2 FK506-binding protein 1 [Coprinopsis cinerea okayama7\